MRKLLVAFVALIGVTAGAVIITTPDGVGEVASGEDQVSIGSPASDLDYEGEALKAAAFFAAVERAQTEEYLTAAAEVENQRRAAAAAAAAKAAKEAEARKRQQAAPAPRTSSPAPNYASGGTVWDRIAQCESGGNWSINTGNGYSGGLQFAHSTWPAYGGREFAPMAYMATREQQIIVAERIRASQGGTYQAWPGCRLKLGLP